MNNAYIRYQEDVVTGMVTYEQFCQNFLMENTPGSTDYHNFLVYLFKIIVWILTEVCTIRIIAP